MLCGVNKANLETTDCFFIQQQPTCGREHPETAEQILQLGVFGSCQAVSAPLGCNGDTHTVRKRLTRTFKADRPWLTSAPQCPDTVFGRFKTLINGENSNFNNEEHFSKKEPH